MNILHLQRPMSRRTIKCGPSMPDENVPTSASVEYDSDMVTSKSSRKSVKVAMVRFSWLKRKTLAKSALSRS